MSGRIREFVIEDYDRVLSLWQASEGLVLRAVDEREPIRRYLERNPGLSFVWADGGTIAGAVLCGTDGRRGYLQHLAVAPEYRRRGIGRALVAACLEALAGRGIEKSHLMVLPTNATALAFWGRIGWAERRDVLVMSYTSSNHSDA
jgi:ribosomal protein S18 acetylase RimI-like enzyme